MPPHGSFFAYTGPSLGPPGRVGAPQRRGAASQGETRFRDPSPAGSRAGRPLGVAREGRQRVRLRGLSSHRPRCQVPGGKSLPLTLGPAPGPGRWQTPAGCRGPLRAGGGGVRGAWGPALPAPARDPPRGAVEWEAAWGLPGPQFLAWLPVPLPSGREWPRSPLSTVPAAASSHAASRCPRPVPHAVSGGSVTPC